MRRLSEKSNVAKTVLKKLSKQPLSHSEIEKLTFRRTLTHAQFEGILKYLAQSGFIQKQEPKRRSHYKITDKGRGLLEATA